MPSQRPAISPIPASYGRGIATGFGRRIAREHGRPVVLTRPAPWSIVGPTFGTEPVATIMIEGLERSRLERLLSELPDGPIVGIGGGSAIDAAKWLAWRRGSPLWLVPSLPSVDAAFMRSVAVRDLDGVHYEGVAAPEVVAVDFDLMRAAPAHLARAGVGDVLSCHTARWDWRYAVDRGHGPGWDPEAAALANLLVDELVDLAPRVGQLTDDGIEGLMEAFRRVGRTIDRVGHARFEEGSEHFFAYAFEEVSGRSLMHGELVSLGTVVMGEVQGGRGELPRRILEDAAVRYRPGQLGITQDVFAATLRRLPVAVREQDRWYSIAHDLEIDEGLIETLWSSVS